MSDYEWLVELAAKGLAQRDTFPMPTSVSTPEAFYEVMARAALDAIGLRALLEEVARHEHDAEFGADPDPDPDPDPVLGHADGDGPEDDVVPAAEAVALDDGVAFPDHPASAPTPVSALYDLGGHTGGRSAGERTAHKVEHARLRAMTGQRAWERPGIAVHARLRRTTTCRADGENRTRQR